jgi:uncharacterized repeat protein (TIGR03803 family)
MRFGAIFLVSAIAVLVAGCGGNPSSNEAASLPGYDREVSTPLDDRSSRLAPFQRQSAHEKLIYTFQGQAYGTGRNDGEAPYAALLADSTGNLYGTTAGGGVGSGTVFILRPSGSAYKESVLYSFGAASKTTDGDGPRCTLISDKTGALYGTTTFGGTYTYGTVFKLTSSKGKFTESILHEFKAGTDGAWPYGGVIADANGDLYGTTANGGNPAYCSGSGPGGCGTVYKLTPSGSSYKETILYAFKGGATDGENPYAALVMDKSGALYGTTPYGFYSSSVGSVYKLTPNGSNYTESIIDGFGHKNDGAGPAPFGKLAIDSKGIIYGTAERGGKGDSKPSSPCPGPDGTGCGMVFELMGSGSTYTEKIIYDVTDYKKGTYPNAGVTLDPNGNIYGTMTEYGASTYGAVYELVPSAKGFKVKVLHSFTSVPDGATPFGEVILDKAGTLFGMTGDGGTKNGYCEPNGCGTVFTIAH